MSGKFLSRTTREQGWAVEGPSGIHRSTTDQAFFSTGKKLWPQNSQQPPPTPTWLNPLLLRAPEALGPHLLYLVAGELPHQVPTLRRERSSPHFSCQGRSQPRTTPWSLSKDGELQPSLGQPRRQQLAYPYPAEVRRAPLWDLLPPGFPVAFFLPFFFF